MTDWLPTLVNLHGGTPPAGLDGHDVWRSLAHGAPVRTELVVNVNHLCHGGQFHAPKAALRVGHLKLLCYCFSAAGIAGATSTGCVGDPDHPGQWPQLYNVTADPGETTNLAAALPGEVRKLEARLAQLAAGPGTAEPMQWTPPYQGKDYYCAACPLRNATGPDEPWTAWLHDPPDL